jgi:hypothetical protein
VSMRGQDSISNAPGVLFFDVRRTRSEKWEQSPRYIFGILSISRADIFGIFRIFRFARRSCAPGGSTTVGSRDAQGGANAGSCDVGLLP